MSNRARKLWFVFFDVRARVAFGTVKEDVLVKGHRDAVLALASLREDLLAGNSDLIFPSEVGDDSELTFFTDSGKLVSISRHENDGCIKIFEVTID